MAQPGRELHTQQTHYLRKAIAFGDTYPVTVGVLPSGAVVLRGYVAVKTAFNAGTTNVLDIGTSADDDGFATDLALGTVGVIPVDEMATSNDWYSTAAVTVTCTYAQTGSAATTGAGFVVVEYVPNNDG